MGHRTYYILITILLLVCFQSEATEKVELKQVKKSISKSVPYSVGIFASAGTTSYAYYMASSNILSSTSVGKAALSGGCYARIHMPQFTDKKVTPYAQLEVAYCQLRDNNLDPQLNRNFIIKNHYITISTLFGISGDGPFHRPVIGFIGFSGDILAGFNGAPDSIEYAGITRECLNTFIPKLVFGTNLFTACMWLPFISLQFEIPLNSGPINLNKYTYYNRTSITSHIWYNISFKIEIRAFGNTHK